VFQARDRGDGPIAANCRGRAAEYSHGPSGSSIKPNAGVADALSGRGSASARLRSARGLLSGTLDPREWLAAYEGAFIMSESDVSKVSQADRRIGLLAGSSSRGAR
jgi:hypothetical protein